MPTTTLPTTTLPTTIPILMYHSISDAAAPGFAKFAVAPARFTEQMQFLQANGFTALTVSQFIDQRRDRLPARPIMLTFDDGFADFHSAALPIMARFGLTATLYVTTASIGGTSVWLAGVGEGARPMLNANQLADVAASGVEIGGHTHTHPALDTLPAAAARDEITRCKTILEDQLGRAVTSFAYPYGYQSAAVRRLTAAAGYTSACAVRYALSSARDDAFGLARLIVPGAAGLSDFEQLVMGGALPPGLWISRTRAAAYALVRHTRHALRRPAGV